MPHSSGGGSHGGGSHHSYHSSRSGSRSGGHTGPVNRSSSTYFPGARRYVIYHRRRRAPMYVYANYDVRKQRSPARYLLLLFYIPFFILMAFMFKSCFVSPKPLEDSCGTGIVIEDGAGVIADEEALGESLEAFWKKTGIAPAVITVYNEQWKASYKDLERYAFSAYVNMYNSDEKHWLIVYSIPAKGGDWSWEGMQGNDTDPIITESRANKFTDKLQKLLEDESDVGVAIAKAFDATTPSIMDSYVDGEMVAVTIFVTLFIGIHCFFMVFYDPNRKYRGAYEYSEMQPEVTCNYCGCKYIEGTGNVCPFCGTAIPTGYIPQNDYRM